MCEAATIAAVSAGASAVGSIAGYMGARGQARDVNRAFSENAEAQITAYQDDIEAANLDAAVSDEAASQRRVEVSREGRAARSSARANAAERGIGGFTLAAIERDLGFQEGEGIAAIDRNQALDDQRHRMSTRATRNGREAAIKSAPRSRGPSVLALGASLAGAAAGGFSDYKMLKAAEG